MADVDVVIDTVHVVDVVVIDDVADVVDVVVVDVVDVAVVDSKPASCPLRSAHCRAYHVQLPQTFPSAILWLGNC